MKTFYLNTCTDRISIAIFDQDHVLAERTWQSHRDEAERIQLEVKKLFRKTKQKPYHIDRIAVCTGPAGFTSARIGVSIANAWSFAMQIPLAQFSVFDCHSEDATVVIPCNQTEAWVREPGEKPKLVNKSLKSSFSRGTGDPPFAKLSSDAARSASGRPAHRVAKSSRKATFQRFPIPGALNFSHQLAHPWYYKDAKITWSERIHSSLPCSTSSQPPSAISKTSPSAR